MGTNICHTPRRSPNQDTSFAVTTANLALGVVVDRYRSGANMYINHRSLGELWIIFKDKRGAPLCGLMDPPQGEPAADQETGIVWVLFG